jgi:branched-chain amino acid transport system substrate-binding protein
MKARAIVPFVIILVLVLTTFPACGGGKKEPTKGDVMVYVAAPLSGFQANGGQTVLGGVRLKAEEINKAGGLLGYRVVVRGIDDESDDEVAAAVADEVAAAVNRGEKVLGVIGHLNSGQTGVGMAVYQNLPIVVITPTASEMALTQSGFRNFFRVNAHNAAQARVAADYLVNVLGVRRVAVLYNDDPYGIDLGQRTADELRALGAEVVLTRQVQVEQERFDAEVAGIRDAGAEGIFYAGYEVECPYLRYDLFTAGLDGLPFLASDGCFLSDTIDNSAPPDKPEDKKAEGMYVLGFAPEPAAVAGADWIKAYQEVEYRNPGTYSVSGYAAMEALAEGIKKASSFDGPQVTEAIRQLSFESLIGTISYDPNGDLKEQRLFVFQVQNGAFKQVAP